MKQTDDKELEASYLVACAENIAWLLDTNRIENDRLEITGWAISLSGEPDKARFLINGSPFEEVQYPIPSPDLAEFFWNIPAATSGRFVCSTPVEWEKTFRDGFACLEFAPIDVNAEDVRRRAWYLPNPQNALPIPDPARIRRVISVPDTASYLLGGAAVYKRVEHYLEQKFSRTFDDFPRTLDFGCGCGRVSRQFAWSPGTKLYGVDIDADNIRWCRDHLPHGEFLQVGLLPPLPFPDNSFDLVIAISVLSQLDEALQLAWLAELQRVARKDALVLVALPGLSQIGLSRPHPDLVRKVEELGCVLTGRSSDLDDVMPNQNHYLSCLHSRDYIRKVWSRYFSIHDFIGALAANHDLIVLKNDQPQQPMDIAAAEAALAPPRENPFALPLRDYDINPFIHPTIVKTGYAGHIVDMQGRDFVDFTCAWGTNLLGFGYRKVARAISRQARQFNSLGLPYPQFEEVKKLVKQLVPSAEEVRYGKNGSDACAGAVRLARFITGREKILYRGYHGFHDWYFASTDCPGIPAALRPTVVSQAELTPAAVDSAFRQYPNEIAGLIMNPLTGPIPTRDEIREVIDVIHDHGGLVIFDEMMSGFRVAPGGMQEIWNVTPDLSCFGKSIANGLPLSVLCGPSEYMRRLPEVYYGMTFEGEAVSIAAAHATLTEVISKNVVGVLYDIGRRIRAGYERAADIYGIPTSLLGFEPCMHMDFHDCGSVPSRHLLWLMIQELMRNGIFTCGAFILCLSHSGRDERKLQKAFESSFSVLRQAIERNTSEGLLDERTRQSIDLVKSPAVWRRADHEKRAG